MKMRMFVAPTLEEAMECVKREMGPDAVILSTREEDDRVEVRAAIERSGALAPSTPIFMTTPQPPKAAQIAYQSAREQIQDALHWQGAQEAFTHLVSEGGARLGAGLEPLGSMAAGLEGVLAFSPLQPQPERSYFLVGPPGGGRSTAAAKLALHMRDGASRLIPVAADFDILAGAERLAALMRTPHVARCMVPEALARLLAESDKKGERLVIDGPAFNPVDDEDMKRLSELISFLNCEPVLVLPADGHPLEQEDTARAFGQIGVRRTILTRLDAVRRKGGVFSAISSARLSIAQLGMGSSTRSGLAPASAALVSRLLLAGAPEAELLKGAA